ncbi:MAG: class I SAM-dependent rRNA methyltransferase [Verrucomicrobia bacterium]|nr:class I SAM-dependent rRNA methyltransferase [Verrucomicrobiota bacterium]
MADAPLITGNRAPWALMRSVTFHPAVFDGMIKKVDPLARDGDEVMLYSKEGQYLGTGLWNQKATIAVRVYSTDPDEVLDDNFFIQRLHRAMDLRCKDLNLDASTDAFRVIHGEGDGLSGCTIDKFRDCVVGEVFSKALWRRIPNWIPVLHQRLGTRFHHFSMPSDIAAKEKLKKVQPVVSDPFPDKIKITENGIRYWVDFSTGHKTGFFCDQRENRKKLIPFCQGKRVLDLCCYSGGFALSAKLGGQAAEVTGVDLDEAAIAVAKRNANLNQARIKWVHADAFSYARQMVENNNQWDVVICDPPKFWLSRDGEREAIGKYNDLNKLAAQLVAPGGLLVTCSCSGLLSMDLFQMTVIKAVHRLGRRLQILDYTGAGADHPVWSSALDTRYLKVLWTRVF